MPWVKLQRRALLGTNRVGENYSEYIERMMRGEAIMRIGPLWYGLSRNVTVANLYYFANKNVHLIPTLRTEVAMSFASSTPPIDSVQVELVIHLDMFQTHVQRLFALSQLMPVVPVLNPVISAIVQPIEHNRRVYSSYGFADAATVDVHAIDEPNPDDTPAQAREKEGLYSRAKEMYASVPVQMKIDNLRLETIDGIPRDMRVLFRATRVLTVNSYGDKVEYLTDMDGAVKQAEYMKEFNLPRGSLKQMETINQLLGVETDELIRMVSELRDANLSSEQGKQVRYTVARVISGTIIQVTKEGTKKTKTVRIAGIEVPPGYEYQAEGTLTTLTYKKKVRLEYEGKVGSTRRGEGAGDEWYKVFVEGIDEKGKIKYTDVAREMLRSGMAKSTGKNISDSDKIQHTRDQKTAEDSHTGALTNQVDNRSEARAYIEKQRIVQ
jgi:endonuclease YncB( thermonuclease family)